MGELLRREGLYSSQVGSWKRELQGNLAGIFTNKRGPKPNPSTEAEKQVASLQKRIRSLEKELDQAKTIIDIQKKISTILGADPVEK